uniref:Uncharacterized protein n=1 Tax=Ascaris lumbricoides TaxID=6252 RepID=A0A0M3IES4_ASCLU
MNFEILLKVFLTFDLLSLFKGMLNLHFFSEVNDEQQIMLVNDSRLHYVS